MGSTLLYGFLLVLIVWWLLRYYLLPWWRENTNSSYSELPESDPFTPGGYGSATNSQNRDTRTRAAKDTSYQPSPRLTTTELPSDVQSQQGNTDSASTVKANAMTRVQSVAGQPPLGDTTEPDAATHLQNKLKVLQQEKNRKQQEVTDALGQSGENKRTDDCPPQPAKDLDVNDKAGAYQPGQSQFAETQIRSNAHLADKSNQAPGAIVGSDTPQQKETSRVTIPASNRETDARILDLEQQIEEYQDDIGLLSSELKAARSYESRYYETDKRIAEHQMQLADKEDEISRLQHQIAQFDSIEKQLDDRETELVEARQEAAQLYQDREKIALLENEVNHKANEISDLKSQLQRLSAMEMDLRDKNQTIHQLTIKADKIAQLESLVASRESEMIKLLEQQDEVEARSAHLDEREAQISKHGTNSSTADEVSQQKLDDLLVTVQQKEQSINQLQLQADKVDALESTIAELEQEIVHLQQEHDQTRQINTSQLADRDIEIASLRARLEQTDNSANAGLDSQPQAEDGGQHSRIKELENALSEAEQLSTASQHNDLELRRLRSELASVIQQRDLSVGEIDSLKARVEQQQRELEEIKTSAQPTHASSRGPNSARPRREPKVIRPLFTAPAEKDDLKKIKGIGPVMEQTLNRLGVTSFKQLSEFSEEDISRVSAALDTFPNRIKRDDWVGGAKRQYEKKYGSKADV